MNRRALRSDILLLLTAAVWGFGFVAQRSGMEYTGPFTYTAIRFMLGSLSLLPLIFLREKHRITPEFHTGDIKEKILSRSLIAGVCLFIAVSLQQIGIMFTTVGNAGFITSLYVVLTPVFGIFLGKKTGLPTWIGTVFTLTGLYCLSAAESGGSVNPGDLIVVISAVFWTCHVLLIDRFVQEADPIKLSSGQFAWCSLLAFAAALTLEPRISQWASSFAGVHELQPWRSLPDLAASLTKEPFVPRTFLRGIIPILYGGLGSVGIAYTLQVVAQKDAPPAHATILLCLESPFAALGGIIILKEKPGAFTFLGFALMLCGMFASQWEVIAGGGKKRPRKAGKPRF
jgi:drug/metabolite transporter (DMT)-like permease